MNDIRPPQKEKQEVKRVSSTESTFSHPRVKDEDSSRLGRRLPQPRTRIEKDPILPSKTKRIIMQERKMFSTDRSRVRIPFWIMMIILGLVVIFVGQTVFSRAHVVLTPRKDAVVLSQIPLSAKKEAFDKGLEFKTVTVLREVSETVPANGISEGGSRASGTIVIFNNESTPQTFREETRFEIPNGLVYKSEKGKQITVPAKY